MGYGEGARVLVVGSTGHVGVKCVAWDAHSFPNVADHDAIVVNAAPLARLLSDASANNNRVTWQRIHSNIEKVHLGVMRLLESQGKAVAIAAPRSTLRFQGRTGGPWEVDTWGWCPLKFTVVKESGDSIRVCADQFRSYMDTVKRWDSYISEHTLGEALHLVELLLGAVDKAAQFSLRTSPVAITRFGGILGAEFSYTSYRNIGGNLTKQESGAFLVLPPPTETDERGAISVILEDVLSIPQMPLPPEWADDLVVPGCGELLGSKSERLVQIERLGAEIRQIEGELSRLGDYKRLLYATGEPLERICKQVLADMGAIITDGERGADDFVMESEGQEAVCEVKGKTKAIDLSDVLKLVRHQEEHQRAHGCNARALLIGNAWLRLAPCERTQAWFPPNVVTHATHADIGLVSTLELYRALCAMREGKLDGMCILRRLLTQRGATRLLGDAEGMGDAGEEER